jgi:hypothetical protein
MNLFNKLFVCSIFLFIFVFQNTTSELYANEIRYKKITESAAKLGVKTGEVLSNYIDLTKKLVGNNIGAIGDIEKIAKTASKTSDGIPRMFKADKAVEHFGKHADNVRNVLGKNQYTLKDYMLDANHTINTGEYAKEINAYVKIVGGPGKAKAAVVGMTQDGKYITTFHIEKANDLWIPGGKLPNGNSEAVLDLGNTPSDIFTITKIE